MNACKPSPPQRILLVQQEYPEWALARQWSYDWHLGIEEGFKAAGVEFTTLMMPWWSHAREICAGQQYDQVWINDIIHTFEPQDQAKQLLEEDLAWLSSLAPVRLGFLVESLDYSPEEIQADPKLGRRLEVVSHALPYLTHIASTDDRASEIIQERYGIPATWMPVPVPARILAAHPQRELGNLAGFSGTPYGARARLLQHPAVQGLMTQFVSEENHTPLPDLFNQLQQLTRKFLPNAPGSLAAYQQYLNALREVRQKSYEYYLATLATGCAVVNLPSLFKGYASRVFEGMAVGIPVISWQVPNRPRLPRLFQNGRDILLFAQDNPGELAEYIRLLQSNREFACAIATCALQKVKKYHTIEIRVAQLIQWTQQGVLPDYGETPAPQSAPAEPASPPTIEVETARQASPASDLIHHNYFLKPGYKSHPRIAYFEDTETEHTGIVWQPAVYPLADALARAFQCSTVVDIGCGHGQKLADLHPALNILGLDFGANIRYCREHYAFGQWLEIDLEKDQDLPVSPQLLSDSIILCSDVIEHLFKPEKLLAKLQAALSHAPVVILSTPERELTHGAGHNGPPPNTCHIREWSLKEFGLLLQATGFRTDWLGLTLSNNREPGHATILAVLGASSGSHLTRLASNLGLSGPPAQISRFYASMVDRLHEEPALTLAELVHIVKI